jgi:hypothetical protein
MVNKPTHKGELKQTGHQMQFNGDYPLHFLNQTFESTQFEFKRHEVV